MGISLVFKQNIVVYPTVLAVICQNGFSNQLKSPAVSCQAARMHETVKTAVIIGAKFKKCDFYWKIAPAKMFLDGRIVQLLELPDCKYLRLPMHTR
jgi:hypothetical protein